MPETFRRYVGTALWRDARGRVRALPRDRLARTVSHLTERGGKWVTVRDSHVASLIGQHRALIGIFREKRDPSVFDRFRNVSFRAGGRTYRFVTDPDVIDELDDAGLLPMEMLYRTFHGGQ